MCQFGVIFCFSLSLQNNTKQTSMDEISLKSELIKQKEELIQCLQNELVEVRLQEAENAVIMSDLRSRIQELEEDKKKLRESVVDNSVAHLQVRSLSYFASLNNEFLIDSVGCCCCCGSVVLWLGTLSQLIRRCGLIPYLDCMSISEPTFLNFLCSKVLMETKFLMQMILTNVAGRVNCSEASRSRGIIITERSSSKSS